MKIDGVKRKRAQVQKLNTPYPNPIAPAVRKLAVELNLTMKTEYIGTKMVYVLERGDLKFTGATLDDLYVKLGAYRELVGSA